MNAEKVNMNTVDETVLRGKTILVVDDENDLREIVASELEYMGATICQAANVDSARDLLNRRPVDLVVSDIRMPGGTGIDLLNFVKSREVDSPPIILITGFADITNEDAFNKGAEALLSKPFKLDELVQTAARLTGPEINRFKERITAHSNFQTEFENTLEEEISAGHIAFGRGGVTLTLNTKEFKSSPGDILKFKIQFKGLSFEGVGICRWWRHKDQAGQSVIGLEFLRLDDNSLNKFLTLMSDKKVVPFIPSLH